MAVTATFKGFLDVPTILENTHLVGNNCLRYLEKYENDNMSLAVAVVSLYAFLFCKKQSLAAVDDCFFLYTSIYLQEFYFFFFFFLFLSASFSTWTSIFFGCSVFILILRVIVSVSLKAT